MPIVALIAIAALCYAVFALTYAKAGSGAGPYVSSAIYLAVGAVVSLLPPMLERLQKTAKPFAVTSQGIFWSVVSGVLIGVFSLILIRIFSRGGLAYVMPAVYGGTIVLSVILARIFFKETVTGLQMAGIAVVALGIGMIVYAKMSTPAA